MRKRAHITVGGKPWCDWTGTQAGREIQDKVARANSNLQPSDVCCGHGSLAGARRIAQALRPHFRPGAVAVIEGVCPVMVD